jgi:putative ABC transport system permease protein
MIRNYFKITWRTIKRHKGYSLINISGLALGITCCIFIFLYIQDELSYDKFHDNAEDIYRVTYRMTVTGQPIHYTITPTPLASALLHKFPEIESAVRLFPNRERLIVHIGDSSYFEEQLFFTDMSFFDVFSFPLLQGDPDSALDEPFSLVVTEEVALKYFGEEGALGKTLTIDTGFRSNDYTITGVVQSLPSNSHFRFNLLTTFSSMDARWQQLLTQWSTYVAYTYIRLRDKALPELLQAKLPGFLKESVHDDTNPEAFLQPLTRIHLHSNLYPELEANGNIVYVYLFSAVAFLILLIASINYVNLATARSATRAREVGMRKVLGASRKQIMGQFWGEAALLTFLSFLLSVCLIEILKPHFTHLTGREWTGWSLNNLWVLALFSLIAFLTGIISGSYPALYLSGFRTDEALKGKQKAGVINSNLRKSLVVFQFGVSVVLILCTFIANRQLKYMKTKELGFQQDHIVVIPIHGSGLNQSYETIKDELLKNPQIISACATLRVPGRGFGSRPIQPEGAAENESIHMSDLWVDHDFVKTYGLKIEDGRDFSRLHETDVNEAFLLNETAVRKLGWDSAVGKRLVWNSIKEGTVIGVVEDFHYRSLHRAIDPLLIHIQPGRYLYFSVRIKPENIQETLDSIRSLWQRFNPGFPFDYFFLDDHFDQLYKGEDRLEQLFESFALLAVFIACLGLLGLTAFSAEQRTREIGIRKVLGATVPNIVLMLSREFMILVLISNAVAWPIAFFVMNRWLRGFAYRTNMCLWFFILSTLMTLFITLVTVSYQAVKAALANPIDSLRYE